MTERQQLLGSYVSALYADRVITPGVAIVKTYEAIMRAVGKDLSIVLGVVAREAAKRFLDKMLGGG